MSKTSSWLPVFYFKNINGVSATVAPALGCGKEETSVIRNVQPYRIRIGRKGSYQFHCNCIHNGQTTAGIACCKDVIAFWRNVYGI